MTGKEKIILTVLVIVMIVLVGCNILLVEYRKTVEARQMEEKARIEREILESIRLQGAEEIAEFGYRYQPVEDEFIEEVSLLSEKIKEKLVSVDNLSEIAAERLDAAEDFRQKLIQIGDVPGPLATFYRYMLEFIENDIETASLVLSYYQSGSYSTYDKSKLEELNKSSNLLFSRVHSELERVYREYDLEFLLQELL